MHRELVLFFQSACLGAVLLLCYDILLVFRNLVTHSRVLIMIQDILYWIAAGFYLFRGIYQGNEGSIRSFLFLGSVAGFFLCRETISPVFLKLLAKIMGLPIVFVKKTVKRLLFQWKRCRIFVFKYIKKFFCRKKKILINKRTEQVEKSRKKE